MSQTKVQLVNDVIGKMGLEMIPQIEKWWKKSFKQCNIKIEASNQSYFTDIFF